MQILPQLCECQMYGSVRRRTVGDRARSWRGDREGRNIADTWSEDGGSLRRRTGPNAMSGTIVSNGS